jgi:phosphoglucomutase
MKKGETNLIFDINKISEFVFGDADKRTSEVEITENFIYDKKEDKMIPNTKEVKEVKVKDDVSQFTIRYDLIKMFIDIMDSVEDLSALTLGQEVTVNTMEAYELIKELKQNNDE